jgi:hypothetical protein
MALVLRAMLFSVLSAIACGESAGDSCTRGVDELLDANDLPREKRERCGAFSYADQVHVAEGLECLQEAIDAKKADCEQLRGLLDSVDIHIDQSRRCISNSELTPVWWTPRRTSWRTGTVVVVRVV